MSILDAYAGTIRRQDIEMRALRQDRAKAYEEIERLRATKARLESELLHMTEIASHARSDLERMAADRDGYRAVAENVQRENESLSSGIRDMHTSYGLLLKDDSRHRAELARLKLALVSIAKNTCCGGCHEAARVAREALEQ